MAPLGPLTTNSLTVRLDAERAARLEYWATENPIKVKSYNQILQEALDDYLDRNTASPTEGSISITMPGKVRDKLHNLKVHVYTSITSIIEIIYKKIDLLTSY